jgi:hypothetical protein
MLTISPLIAVPPPSLVGVVSVVVAVVDHPKLIVRGAKWVGRKIKAPFKTKK